ncbi:nucleotide sugar dehydrogenase [Halococcoides cellulosivorans]|uniref:UDP-N-acetyl-D-mannosamine dehydrogenase n=1 Tax=Halococcoides cellulosivorans TaxID=1679096 RepID=A0A2R4X3F1_9EURY|nr:nucleotide sugar dehydrogenase [Halococcoides cellulosivorans]AWB28318.1 nucleotide sugar dehydrogenase [Halococcoides cellulosivorans]
MSRTASRAIYDTSADDDQLREAFTSGELPVAIYGLGKMGLPLAGVYADVTGATTGVDIDQHVVDQINAGESPIKREPGLPELVERVVADGALEATADAEGAAADATIHVLMVPTLLTAENDPDLSIMDEVIETVGHGLDPGDLVIVESTVPPRTTVDRFLPRLLETSGLDPDQFGLAACPERTVSGQAIADVRGTHPKIVGGVDPESTRAAAIVYDEISENRVVETSNATAAEMTKVFEGVFRDVNIAIANELATFAKALDVDVREAIDAANTQPFCDIHDPGPGVGGHCIPIYPYFLAGQFDVDADLLETARERNDGMAIYTADMTEAILDSVGVPIDEATVLLLGVTYKANIAELRNAPSIPVAESLKQRGATVEAVDPLIDRWHELDAMTPVTLDAAADRDPDAVVVVTPHDDFADLDWAAFDAPILDGRSSIDASATDAPVYAIGGPWP